MRRATLFVLGALVGGLLAVAPPAAAAPSVNGFQTGFLDDSVFGGPWASLGFQRAADAGATVVRLRLDWSAVAPAGASKPSGFDATNPSDPRYNWTAFDNLVTAAIANGQTADREHLLCTAMVADVAGRRPPGHRS